MVFPIRTTKLKKVTDKFYKTTITSAQLLALNATPVTVLPAPGAGLVNVITAVYVSKAAGTAYAGIAAGEDLALKYTDASGSIASTIETTGFLDSASATFAAGAPSASCFPVANAAIVANLLVGEITTGTSDIVLRMYYKTIPAAL